MKKIIASILAFLAPAIALAAPVCRVNGEIVQCPAVLESILPFMWIFNLVLIVVIVLVFAAQWKIFTKAGKPGWASIIPIYNIIVMLRIVNRPTWWIILCIIPFVNIIATIIIMNDLSKSFGKGIGFTLGLIFLSPIFILILGFGSAQYMRVERVVNV